jgi:hypothetical protein
MGIEVSIGRTDHPRPRAYPAVHDKWWMMESNCWDLLSAREAESRSMEAKDW